LRNALYRNNRDGTFTDVTEKVGVGGGGYGMGVAVGDYDGDGFPLSTTTSPSSKELAVGNSRWLGSVIHGSLQHLRNAERAQPASKSP
jgi:FG-GAP-like repeat